MKLIEAYLSFQWEIIFGNIISSNRDLKTAQKSLFLNWPILTLLSLSTSFAGLAMFSKYADCDPILAGRVSTTDQIMPLYVLDALGHLPGLPGLFIAGIFSGSLSTVSGALNSLAAVTVEDYIKVKNNVLLRFRRVVTLAQFYSEHIFPCYENRISFYRNLNLLLIKMKLLL